jgi:hypothetical protein
LQFSKNGYVFVLHPAKLGGYNGPVNRIGAYGPDRIVQPVSTAFVKTAVAPVIQHLLLLLLSGINGGGGSNSSYCFTSSSSSSSKIASLFVPAGARKHLSGIPLQQLCC